jgi:hypothetical protein
MVKSDGSGVDDMTPDISPEAAEAAAPLRPRSSTLNTGHISGVDANYEPPKCYDLDSYATEGLTFKILRAAVCTQPLLVEYFDTPFELAM